MNFYAAPTTEINGVNGKPQLVVMAKEKISEQEFTGIINAFIDNSDVPHEEKIETKNKIWENLHKGLPVNLGNRTLTIKKK